MEVLVNNIGDITVLTLISREAYQKQLCIIPPRTKIPLHKHKNVRTNIIFLDGYVIFLKDGRSLELLSPQDSQRGFIIDPGQEHGAYTLDRHCIFLTEQYWLDNEKVRSLHLQWEGEPMNKEHEQQLNSRTN